MYCVHQLNKPIIIIIIILSYILQWALKTFPRGVGGERLNLA